jgi:hypothetical protein
MEEVRVGELDLPSLLDDMLSQGRWPRSQKEAMKPAVSGEAVRSLAPDENEIWLCVPPFHTVAEDNLAWLDQFRVREIDFDRAVILGDFGPGSDSPLVLDFGEDPPSVKRLKITAHPNPNAGTAPWPEGARFRVDGHWVTMSNTFDELVLRLGL